MEGERPCVVGRIPRLDFRAAQELFEGAYCRVPCFVILRRGVENLVKEADPISVQAGIIRLLPASCAQPKPEIGQMPIGLPAVTGGIHFEPRPDLICNNRILPFGSFQGWQQTLLGWLFGEPLRLGGFVERP